MDAFDVRRLTDVDFEVLCKDLLGEVHGVRFEAYAQGRDGGIDLKYIEPGGNVWVVQCKHWWRSGPDALIRSVRRYEKAKVDRLKPGKYILTTSADLTPGNKETLQEALRPHVVTTGDIWGSKDIVEELRRRDEVVQRHMRLWINSAAVLQAMLTYSTRMRSSMVQEELEDNLRTFVPNECFPRAVDILRERHVCIIAGIPGVGKTTLAQALAAAYVHDGFELIDVGEDIEQALSAWNDRRSQIFYYDDFLGQTTLDDKLGKSEDVRLINFLRKVQRSTNKRIVLTTREYILENARQRYERLASAELDPFTCVVELNDYSDMIRAKVLYNHLYFANLTPNQRAEFVEPSRHRAILEHPNFSPRLISLTLASALPPTESAFQALRRGLDSPYRLWEHIVRYQLDEHQVSLLEALYCLPSATADGLRLSWTDLCNAKGITAGSSRFRNALEVLEGALVRISGPSNRATFSFANPSLRDYMDRHITQNAEVLESLLRSAAHFEQVQILSIACRSVAPSPSTRTVDLLAHRLGELLYHPPLIGTLEDVLPDRYATLLQVADAAGQRSLASEVLEELSNDSDVFTQNCSNLDSLVALVEVVSESELANEHYPYLEAELGAALMRKIEGSAMDWDTAKAAQDALAALDHHDWFDPEAAEKVEETVREAAVVLIDAWRAGDKAVRQRTDMYEVLERADLRLIPDDRGDLYSPAEAFSNFISLVEDHPFTGEVPRKPTSGRSDNWPEITRLFARCNDQILLEAANASMPVGDHLMQTPVETID